MVDIINGSLGVDQLNEILDNLNNIFFRQHSHINISVESQLLVYSVTTNIS